MKREYRSFKDAQKFVRGLGLKSRLEWRDYCKSGEKPEDIPFFPEGTYKKDFKGMGDWLGTGNISNRDKVYRSFKDAREFASKMGLKTVREWEKYCKSGDKPDDIHSIPSRKYKNKGWTNWGDFLGTGNVNSRNIQFRSYKEAQEFVRKLGIKSKTEWEKYCKSGDKPDNIPSAPKNNYKKEWKGWGIFLGTGNLRPQDRKYRQIKEAREFVRKLNLKNYREWEEYCKSGDKPDDIPAAPWEVYKEWKKE